MPEGDPSLRSQGNFYRSLKLSGNLTCKQMPNFSKPLKHEKALEFAFGKKSKGPKVDYHPKAWAIPLTCSYLLSSSEFVVKF